MLGFLKRHYLPLLIFSVSGIIEAYGEPARLLLRYDAAMIADGQWWRLWTANLVHTNLAHWLLNSTGLFMIWIIFRDQLKSANCWALLLLILAPTHLLLLYWFAPSLKWYVGLSGLLHGWLAAAALFDVRARYWVGFLLFGGLIAKIGWEHVYGASEQIKALIHANVATQAHLSGALVGSVLALLWPRFMCSHCGGQEHALTQAPASAEHHDSNTPEN